MDTLLDSEPLRQSISHDTFPPPTVKLKDDYVDAADKADAGDAAPLDTGQQSSSSTPSSSRFHRGSILRLFSTHRHHRPDPLYSRLNKLFQGKALTPSSSDTQSDGDPFDDPGLDWPRYFNRTGMRQRGQRPSDDELWAYTGKQAHSSADDGRSGATSKLPRAFDRRSSHDHRKMSFDSRILPRGVETTSQTCYFTYPSVARIVEHLDLQTLKAFRLTMRKWYLIACIVRPLKYPTVYKLPREIVARIMGYLDPVDFMTAGRTCYKWRNITFDKSSLAMQRCRLGWPPVKAVKDIRDIVVRETRLSTRFPEPSGPALFKLNRQVTIFPDYLRWQGSVADLSSGVDPVTWHVSECGYYIILVQNSALSIQRLDSDGLHDTARIGTGRLHTFDRTTCGSADHGTTDHDCPLRRPHTFVTEQAVWSIRTVGNSRHYLSDKHHFLAMNNDTGLLAMCSQAMFGGPSMLHRSFFFVPPDAVLNSVDNLPPRATSFKVAASMGHGVRVVAVYDDAVVLFTVPPVALAASPTRPHDGHEIRSIRPEIRLIDETRDRTGSNERGKSLASAKRPQWLEWWPEVHSRWTLPVTKDDCFPLLVAGRIIGRHEGLVDIAVQVHMTEDDDGPMTGLSIWGFCDDGQAVCWQAGTCRD